MQSRRKLCGSAPVWAVLPTILFSPFAFAQSADTKSLPAVNVTGTRFEQALLDEPVQTFVISADDIYRSGASTLIDVLARQASIQIIDSSGNPNKQVDMRGFGMTGDQNTLILLDGQRITENELASADLASIPLNSIERIEILRGSGGVLYGRGTAGGTINIITKRASDGVPNATVSATIGSYGTRGLAGSASITNDRLGMAVFFDREESDNYRRNNHLLQENITSTLSYRTDGGPINLRISSGQQKLGLAGSRTASELLTDPRGTSTPTNSASLDTFRASLGTEQKFGFGYAAMDITHRDREAKTVYSDYFIFTPDLTKGKVLSMSPRLRIPFEWLGASQTTTIGSDWERWTWSYYNSDTDATAASTARQYNTSFYARNTTNFAHGTSVAVGIRQQHVSTDVHFPSAAQIDRNVSAHELAIRQDLDDGWSLHAKTGRSFRLQTVDELRPPMFGSTQPTLLEPQTSRDIDFGASLKKQAYFVSVNLFKMQINNEIMFYPTPVNNNVNLPPTERRGVEIDLKWTPASSWSVDGSYAFTDAKFTSGSVGGQSVVGKDVPLVPKHRVSLAGTWRALENSTLTLRSTYNGSARLDNDQTNTSAFLRPSYTVTDLVATHQAGAWRLRASVLNMFDKAYFSYGGVSGASYYAYPAMRRAAFLSAEYKF